LLGTICDARRVRVRLLASARGCEPLCPIAPECLPMLSAPALWEGTRPGGYLRSTPTASYPGANLYPSKKCLPPLRGRPFPLAPCCGRASWRNSRYRYADRQFMAATHCVVATCVRELPARWNSHRSRRAERDQAAGPAKISTWRAPRNPHPCAPPRRQ